MLLSIRRMAMVVVCAFACVLIVGGASAWALEGFAVSTSGSLAGPPGGFQNPLGVAVNQTTGNVYVSDYSSGMVDQFNAAGSYVSQIAIPGGNPYFVAVDNSAGSSHGDVYVAGSASNVIYKFEALANGSLVRDATTPEIGAGLLEKPVGVAVDSAGDVYVASFASEASGTVSKFSPTGQVLDADLITGLPELQDIAVGPEGNIYISSTSGSVGTVEYGPTGECIDGCAHINSDNNNRGVAVTAGGELLVSDQDTNRTVEYGPGSQHALIQEIGSFELSFGVAVDEARHTLYVVDFLAKKVDEFEGGSTPEAPTTGAAEVNGATAVLHGTLNPGGSAKAGWRFEYNQNGGCTDGGATPLEAEVEGSGLAVSAEARGLEPSRTYTYCMLSHNKYGFEYGSPESLTTSASQPYVESESVSGVGTTQATLEARVNPEVQETKCLRFEYGETVAYGHSVSCSSSSLGGGYGGVGASAVVSGLKPSTAYHFRVVVENATSPVGGTFGADEVFRTAPLVAGESFSGVGQDGATLSAVLSTGGLSTSYYFEYGPTVAYGSRTPVEIVGEGELSVAVSARVVGLVAGSEYHFRVVAQNTVGGEDGVDGVFSTLVAPVGGLPDGRVYEMVSPPEDAGADVYFPSPGNYGLSGQGEQGFEAWFPMQVALSGERVSFVAEPFAPGGNGLTGDGLGNEYVAVRDAGGGWSSRDLSPDGNTGASYEAFSPELQFGFIAAASRAGGNGEPPRLPLAAGAPSGVDVLYEQALSGSEGFTPEFTVTPPNRGHDFTSYGVPNYNPDGSGIVVVAGASADGSRVFFEGNDALTPEAEPGDGEANNLYESVGGQLRLVNVLPGGGTKVGATFGAPILRERPLENEMPDFSNAVSEDGLVAFWTDLNSGRVYAREDGSVTVPVSAGAARYWTATPDGSYAFYTENGGLWRYATQGETRVAVAPTSAEVKGVVGVSDDGEYVYFVAGGVLAGGAGAGEANLYVWHAGTTSFIATLNESDGSEMPPFEAKQANKEAGGDWQPAPGLHTAQVTPDGHALVFMSTRNLTGYDNNANVGYQHRTVGMSEVFVYEDEDGGRLFCASCARSGEPPQETEIAKEGHAAGWLPVSWEPTVQSRTISDDGSRVFFDADVPLVANDTNGVQDVYEWERDGSGGCREADGCIYLLTNGSGAYDSWLVGSSGSGNDVFFVTREQLSSEDGNEEDDLYDARVDGVAPPVPSHCAGTGCQGLPPAPPVFATPASVTFSGVGNFATVTPAAQPRGKTSKPKQQSRSAKLRAALKRCAKKRGQHRKACEERERARYRTVAARKANRTVKSTRGRA